MEQSHLLRATDPPHTDGDDFCSNCHIPHNAPSGQLTTISGNVNLCMSCHMPGGSATNKPLADIDEALPMPGLPAGTNASGTSHRWDSGPAGHAAFLGGAATNSFGTLISIGTYTGAFAKTYTITITNAGNSGTALFNWITTSPNGSGSGTNVLSGTNIALNEGVSVTFINSTNTNSPSFQANDKWNIYVRTDLRLPTNSAILARMTNGLLMCSSCHDQHKQSREPFDPAAPTYSLPTYGAGRHYMRYTNDLNQMCVDCHTLRNVTNSAAGSHPVGFMLTNAWFQVPTNVPLDKGVGAVRCMTCHQLHYTTTTDGTLLRMTNRAALCLNCHLLADSGSPARHLSATNNNTLWPGGQYGTTFPQRTNLADRGSCVNCHNAHGWPDTANVTNDYPKLLVEREESLCFTCHDTNGPSSKNLQTDFAKTLHHPVSSTDRLLWPGRSVECTDCHNPHRALAGAHNYSTPATTNRNAVSNPIKGASGVTITYTSLTNFQSIGTNLYTVIGKGAGSTNSITLGATNEYQICFKCHSGYSFPNYAVGTATFTTNSVTVAGIGTSWTNTMIGQWIVRANDATNTTAYLITNVVNSTNLAVSPRYGGPSKTNVSYTIWNPPSGLSPIYNTGTANFTTNSTSVGGSGTTWNSGMIGAWIRRTNDVGMVYKITAVSGASSLTISPAYAGATASGQGYIISLETDLAQECSSQNKSGHPVVTGLNNYSNSVAVGSPARRGLQPTYLKAPWTNNVGAQTMMCSDCHNTDAASSAAQGPHGSAYQFLLRGTNANNWPNVTLSNFATSWCANCHNTFSNDPHGGNHSSFQCYRCHIIVPHGGKVSRLIATRSSGFPARYAWQNNTNNVSLARFTKTATASYSQSNCGGADSACTGNHSSGNGTESW